jgi:hypothetical protein
MLLLPKVQSTLEKAGRGGVALSSRHSEEFVESAQLFVKKQFVSREQTDKIRMSGLGRPLCQQQLSLSGEKEDMEYTTFMRFIFGDMIESLVVLIMRAADINIIELQKQVELDLGDDIVIRGTLDAILDDGTGPKVWDIKSASDFAFNHKFGNFGGYEAIKKEDTFGYLMQGYLYSTAVDLPFGGWIVVNKNSGEWVVCHAPDDQEDDRRRYIEDAKSRAKYLMSKAKFRKEFQPENEMHKNEPTGNKLMHRTCTFCGYKSKCWPKAVYAPKATSRAQSRPGTWYTTHKTESVY